MISLIAALALGSIVELETPSAAYCATLPTANGDGSNLRTSAASQTGAVCGYYRVTCPGIDDRQFYSVELPAAGTEHGVVASLSGHGGSGFHTQNFTAYAAAGLRAIAWAYDMPSGYEPWLCAKVGCPQYADPAEPGVLAAACRQATIISYFTPAAPEPMCEQAHSTGTAGAAYALAHYGIKPQYAQLTAPQPAARMDYGCDGTRYGQTTRGWNGTNPDGTLQTVTGRYFAYWRASAQGSPATETFTLGNGLPADTCDVGHHTTDEQNARLAANSVVSPGADYDFGSTVIDHFACLSAASVTDGNGSWWLDQVTPANPGRVFVQGLPTSSGILSALGDLVRLRAPTKNCTGEEVWTRSNGQPSPIAQLTIDRMVSLCAN